MNPVELSREDVEDIQRRMHEWPEHVFAHSIRSREVMELCTAALRYLKLREGHPGITISTDNGVKLAGEALDREVDL